MTASLHSFTEAKAEREFRESLARLSADLVAMRLVEVVLTDLTKHLERSRGLADDLSGSRGPQEPRSGAQHEGAA